MKHTRIDKDTGLMVITLGRGKANAMNGDMVQELLLAAEEARNDSSISGLVFASDSPRFFSGGFDVVEVFGYDRDKMKEFFGRFIDLYEGLYRFPKPVVGAVSGHAYAGGAVLALSFDYRVFAEGSYGFALNEIDLGVALPTGIVRMAIHAVGYRRACKMVLSGQPLSPGQALEAGLADEVASSGAIVERAVAQARALAGKAPSAFAAMKSATRQLGGYGPGVTDRNELDQFLDSWFSVEAEVKKRALVQSLGAQ
jgi:enoyl-CoA hydratase/carnithine racemase